MNKGSIPLGSTKLFVMIERNEFNHTYPACEGASRVHGALE